MFEGQVGKDLMIQQGYVPATCTLPAALAGPLIYKEIEGGRSPCWGCHGDRTICGGLPLRETAEGGAAVSGLSMQQDLAVLHKWAPGIGSATINAGGKRTDTQDILEALIRTVIRLAESEAALRRHLRTYGITK